LSLGNGIASNGAHEVPPSLLPLNPKSSYDVGWQAAVEKDDTDNEHGLGDTVNDTDLEGKDELEESTSASVAVVAEEGTAVS
jgi:hypothetical protein